MHILVVYVYWLVRLSARVWYAKKMSAAVKLTKGTNMLCYSVIIRNWTMVIYCIPCPGHAITTTDDKGTRTFIIIHIIIITRCV